MITNGVPRRLWLRRYHRQRQRECLRPVSAAGRLGPYLQVCCVARRNEPKQ
jgi:hypothetical protein